VRWFFAHGARGPARACCGTASTSRRHSVVSLAVCNRRDRRVLPYVLDALARACAAHDSSARLGHESVQDVCLGMCRHRSVSRGYTLTAMDLLARRSRRWVAEYKTLFLYYLHRFLPRGLTGAKVWGTVAPGEEAHHTTVTTSTSASLSARAEAYARCGRRVLARLLEVAAEVEPFHVVELLADARDDDDFVHLTHALLEGGGVARVHDLLGRLARARPVSRARLAAFVRSPVVQRHALRQGLHARPALVYPSAMHLVRRCFEAAAGDGGQEEEEGGGVSPPRREAGALLRTIQREWGVDLSRPVLLDDAGGVAGAAKAASASASAAAAVRWSEWATLLADADYDELVRFFAAAKPEQATALALIASLGHPDWLGTLCASNVHALLVPVPALPRDTSVRVRRACARVQQTLAAHRLLRRALRRRARSAAARQAQWRRLTLMQIDHAPPPSGGGRAADRRRPRRRPTGYAYARRYGGVESSEGGVASALE
jgi:hypothetical protein